MPELQQCIVHASVWCPKALISHTGHLFANNALNGASILIHESGRFCMLLYYNYVITINYMLYYNVICLIILHIYTVLNKFVRPPPNVKFMPQLP